VEFIGNQEINTSKDANRRNEEANGSEILWLFGKICLDNSTFFISFTNDVLSLSAENPRALKIFVSDFFKDRFVNSSISALLDLKWRRRIPGPFASTSETQIDRKKFRYQQAMNPVQAHAVLYPRYRTGRNCSEIESANFRPFVRINQFLRES
jgi:hypothetical protein